MQLILNRLAMGARGTNGQILVDGKHVCYTIERPWLNNQRRISCIPEGVYELRRRFSKKFNWHLHLQEVPGRDLILIHPANDAMKELNGCIAPVTDPTELGKGTGSRNACEKLWQIVSPLLEEGQKITIQITNPK